jgi:membrane peptidoglycan carboxypeptidase
VTNTAAGTARRNVVLDRMAQYGAATPAAVAKAKATKFDPTKVKRTINGCQGTTYPFVCDYVYRSLQQTASLGSTVAQRQQTIKQGGLTIQTELDPATQKTVQKQVSKAVGPTDPVIAAMDMVQPGTGMIVAMAQSRPKMGTNTKKGQTYWNYSVPPSMGGAQGFQAGSTFKAFTAAAALEKGIPLSQKFDAQSTMNFSGAGFDSCSGPTTVSGNWQVSNSTGVNGVMDMNKAAEFSVNTYFVQLALKVGMCDVTKMAEKLGVQSNTAGAPISSYDDKPSFTLGTVEVSPLSMAAAYATFASGGIHCDPVIVSKITDSSGANRAATSANCQRVISSDVANTMNSLLSKVMSSGTGRRALTGDGRPEAGKTGTIDSNAAVWFVGYTPQVAGAAMISIDNTRAPFIRTASGYERGLKGYTVPSTGLYLEGSGSGDAGQDIWKPAMQKYLSGKPVENFNPAPDSLVYGQNYGFGFGPGGNQPGAGQSGGGLFGGTGPGQNGTAPR